MSCYSSKQKYLKNTLTWFFPLFAMSCLDGLAMAQSLYRCGNSYQDRPCETRQGDKVKVIASHRQGSESGSADATCTQRGADAVKIVWRREGGTTQEQALSQATSSLERELVAEVYRIRGTTAQVRTRIEADCMEEKERKARYAALIDATKPVNAAAGSRLNSSADQPQTLPTAAAPSNSTGVRNTDRQNSTCGSLTAKLDNIKSRQRAGGSMSTMEELNRNLKDTERMMQQVGCS